MAGVVVLENEAKKVRAKKAPACFALRAFN
jgi:hypothetical protein